MTDSLDESKICVVNACICCYNGLLLDPSCLGCMGKSECLCLTHEVCLKAGTPPLLCTPPEGHMCQLGFGICAYGLKTPTVLCKGQEQICCIVQAAAFPTDNEVPAMLSLYGMMCFPKPGCCNKIGDIRGNKVSPGAPPVPETALELPETGLELAPATSTPHADEITRA